MPLMFPLLQEFLLDIQKQEKPLRLLNHLFHDTQGLSYQNDILKPLEQREKQLQLLKIDKVDEVNNLYKLYFNDCKYLLEKLNEQPCPLKCVTEEAKKRYIITLTSIISRLEGQPEFDRLKAINETYEKFRGVFADLAHDAAWHQYQEIAKKYPDSSPESNLGQIDRLLDTLKKALQPQSSRGDVEMALTHIEQWQKEYDGLPTDQQWQLSRLLNERGIGFASANAKPTPREELLELKQSNPQNIQTNTSFEYLLAEIVQDLRHSFENAISLQSDAEDFSWLQFERPKVDNPLNVRISGISSEGSTTSEEESDVNPGVGFENQFSYQYLSGYLLEQFKDSDDFQVVPAQASNFPKDLPEGMSKVFSHGSILIGSSDDDTTDEEDDNASTISAITMDSSLESNVENRIQYTEYADKNNKVALINNEIKGQITKEEINTVLNHQVNYLKTLTNAKEVSDEFVFRLEFQSQQHFKDYQRDGNLRAMLEKFAKDHSGFSIKVVIKNNLGKKEIIQHYASFTELFDKMQEHKRQQVPGSLHQNALISRSGAGSALNISRSSALNISRNG